MGYTTDFSGAFLLDRPLEDHHREYLSRFAAVRHMRRETTSTATYPDPVREAVGLDVGHEGAYILCEEGKNVLDPNSPPEGQPGLYCQWTPNADGTALEWDENEKFYHYVEWLEYLVEHFLKPWGYELSGSVHWYGEDPGDSGVIYAKGHRIKAVPDEILRKEPNWDE